MCIRDRDWDSRPAAVPAQTRHLGWSSTGAAAGAGEARGVLRDWSSRTCCGGGPAGGAGALGLPGGAARSA
eukprot:4829824-Alexandrium_andersonii.AAC.1